MAIKISGNTVIDDSQNWTGATIPVAKGGTGATSLSGVLIGNGTDAFTTKTNPTGDLVGTTATQTLTNKTINDELAVINNDLWDSTKTYRIVNSGHLYDSTLYSTTGSGMYGGYLNLTPTKSGTCLIGFAVSNMYATIADNTGGDTGITTDLWWYNGTAYVTGAFNGIRSLQTSGGLSSGTNRVVGTSHFKLASSELRSDTGNWFLRIYATRVYSGNEIRVYGTAWNWWEIEE